MSCAFTTKLDNHHIIIILIYYSKYNMIEPNRGRLYKIRYIGGTLYTNQEYETFATFIKISKDNQYIFIRDIPYDKKYWVIYVDQKNILAPNDAIEIEVSDIDNIELYILKSQKFFTTSINKQSHSCYIDYYKIADFMHEYYKPETGEGYLAAAERWDSRNSGSPEN